jgi:hypothetical protein
MDYIDNFLNNIYKSNFSPLHLCLTSFIREGRFLRNVIFTSKMEVMLTILSFPSFFFKFNINLVFHLLRISFWPTNNISYVIFIFNLNVDFICIESTFIFKSFNSYQISLTLHLLIFFTPLTFHLYIFLP